MTYFFIKVGSNKYISRRNSSQASRKQVLFQLCTDKIVRDLVREYEMAPSVFQLQKIEKQINSNCQVSV